MKSWENSKRLQKTMIINKCQYSFMPEKSSIVTIYQKAATGDIQKIEGTIIYVCGSQDGQGLRWVLCTQKVAETQQT